jgi:hypothetical protein
MTKEDRRNAFLFCKFRDEQFALYDEYAKRNGILMKTFLVLNALFYAKDGTTQTRLSEGGAACIVLNVKRRDKKIL